MSVNNKDNLIKGDLRYAHKSDHEDTHGGVIHDFTYTLRLRVTSRRGSLRRSVVDAVVMH